MAFCLNKSDKTVKKFIDRVGENQAAAIAEMVNQEVPIMIKNDKGGLVQSQLFKSLLTETKGDYQEAFNKYLVSEFGEKESTNDTNIKNDTKAQDKELDGKLKSFLSQYGITVEAYETLKGRVNGDPVAAADILNKIILVNENKADKTTIPEEAAHFAIELLGDNHPLVKRLMNTIDSFPEYQKVVDDYSDIYKGDDTKIRKEAVGKVLSKYIIKESEDNITKAKKNLLQRVWDSFMRIVGKIPSKDLKATSEAIYSDVAKDMLKGDLKDADVSNLDKSKVGTLFSKETDRVLTRYETSLSNIIATEVKRLKIFYNRKNEKFTTKEKDLIKKLTKNLEDSEAEKGIVTYLKNAQEEFKKINTRLQSLKEEAKDLESANVKNLVKAYRDMRNYIQAFEPIIDELVAEINSDKDLDPRVKTVYKRALREFRGTIEDANNDYFEMGVPLVSKFLEPFLGDRGVIPFGPDKGKKFDLAYSLKHAKSDISFWDKMFDSLADSSDELLRVIDIATKRSIFDANQSTLKSSKMILNAHTKLKKAGYDDLFMFEKTKDGKLSKHYISKYNIGDFEKAKHDFFNKIGNRENYVGGHKGWDIEVAKWYKANVVEDASADKGYRPSNAYLNDSFNKMSKEQAEYHSVFMNELTKLRNLIPEKYRSQSKLIMMRKNSIERMKNATKKDGVKGLLEAASEGIVRNEDEDEYGASFKITNFDGKEASFLPIYYNNDIKETNNISTDTVFTLSSFASMAYNYSEMSKIVDVLEMAKDLVGERKSEIMEGGKTKKESLSGVAGDISRALTKKGDETNVYERLESYYNMVLYGKTRKDEGTIGNSKVDKAKAVGLLGTFTAVNSLAMNTYAGIANVNLGKAMMRIEALAGEYVKYKSLLKADKIYGKQLMDPTNGVLANMGKDDSTNKLDLWSEKFDTLQDFKQNIKEIDTKGKWRAAKLFKLSSLFFINKCGEHYMQNRMTLALASEIKMKDKDGNVITLWDAYDVKDNALVLKDGVTKEDGSKWTADDEFAFEKKNDFINNRLHGIYNDTDKSAIQQYSAGRLGIMFRKYLKPGLNRRFDKLQYNYEGQVWTEGYYKTTGRFMKLLYKDLKNLQFDAVAHWDELHGVEKANLLRSLGDVVYLVGTITLASILTNMAADDDDDDWAVNQMAYQANRLFTEIGALTPSPLLVSEGYKILKSPMPAVSVTQDVLNFLQFWKWTDEIEYGKYKGQSYFRRSGMKFVKPIKNVEDIWHPEEKNKFFN